MNSYPENWFYIAYSVKSRAGWHCEACNHSHDPGTGYTLTVHHLDGDKSNCDFSNLVALCQRCHLTIQARFNPNQLFFSFIDPPFWAVERNLF